MVAREDHEFGLALPALVVALLAELNVQEAGKEFEQAVARERLLWEEALSRDSLLELLARFLHIQFGEKRDDQGRKGKTEFMIFPRYHQLEIGRAACRERV